MPENTRVSDTFGRAIGDVVAVSRGLQVISNPKIEKFVDALAVFIDNLSDIRNELDPDGTKLNINASNDIDRASEFLVSYVDDSGKKFSNKPIENKLKVRAASILIDGAWKALVDIQKVLVKDKRTMSKIAPSLRNVANILRSIKVSMPDNQKQQKTATKHGTTVETKARRSRSLSEKINGRLAVVECVSATDKMNGLALIRRKYGNRLAALVENGNCNAIKLTKCLNKRHLMSEDIERNIQKTSAAIGFNDGDTGDVICLMRLAASPSSFTDVNDFKSNLAEGLLLNVTTIASKALSIPTGEYAVLVTNAKNTMLIPTSESTIPDGVVGRHDRHDIVTADLVGCWNKLERVIGG